MNLDSPKWDSMKDLLLVAKGWQHNDDWGVPVISVDLLTDLAICLDMGDDRDILRRHGKHMPDDCKTADCKTAIPAYFRMKKARGQG